MIGAFVNDWMMGEDIDMGKASGIGDPIRTLEISTSRPNIKYGRRGLSLAGPRLPRRGLLHFQP